MNILGVGPLELILVLLVVFIVLSPDDIVSTGKKLGRFLSAARKSEVWNSVTRVNRTIKDLPSTLIREAELEDVKREIEKSGREFKDVTQELQIHDVNKIAAQKKASLELALQQKDSGQGS